MRMSIQATVASNSTSASAEHTLKEKLLPDTPADSASATISTLHAQHGQEQPSSDFCSRSLLVSILEPTDDSPLTTEPQAASSSFSCFRFLGLTLYGVTVFCGTMLFWIGLSALLNQHTFPQTTLRDVIYSVSGAAVLAAVGTLLPNCLIFEAPTPEAAQEASKKEKNNDPTTPLMTNVAVDDNFTQDSTQTLCLNFQSSHSLLLTYARAIVSLVGMVFLWVSLGNLLGSAVDAAISIPQLPSALAFTLIFVGCIILMEANGHLQAIGSSFACEENATNAEKVIDQKIKPEETLKSHHTPADLDGANLLTPSSQHSRSRLLLYVRAPFSLCGVFTFWIALLALLNATVADTGPVASVITCAVGLIVLAAANAATIFKQLNPTVKKQTGAEFNPAPHGYQAAAAEAASGIVVNALQSEQRQLEANSYQLMSQSVSDVDSQSTAGSTSSSAFSNAFRVRVCGLFTLLGGLLFFIGSWNLFWNSRVKQFGVWLPLTYTAVGLVGLIVTDTFLLNCGIVRNKKDDEVERKRQISAKASSIIVDAMPL